jgi:hypothetical protein
MQSRRPWAGGVLGQSVGTVRVVGTTVEETDSVEWTMDSMLVEVRMTSEARRLISTEVTTARGDDVEGTLGEATDEGEGEGDGIEVVTVDVTVEVKKEEDSTTGADDSTTGAMIEDGMVTSVVGADSR